MRDVIGAVLIVVGIGQILLRERIARAGAASNNVMFGGRMTGAGWQRYNRGTSVVVGVVFVVIGILMVAHIVGHHTARH